MIKNDDLAGLDAYDQRRIDTNGQFIEILERGIRETNTRADLIKFLAKELNLPDLGMEVFGE